MIVPEAKRIVDDIKSLKTQGARNVAKAGLAALSLQAEKSRTKNVKELVRELQEVRTYLIKARETEPMMRNFLSIVFSKIEAGDARDVSELKAIVDETTVRIIEYADDAIKQIMLYGSHKVPDNGVVLTHCHSSTVIGVLEKAWKAGKRFKVFATETRPLYQGHRTVTDLANIGIPVTLIVDSAVPLVMPKINMCLVGCDVITVEGVVINKVGTKNLALAANYYGVPIYVCGETFKMDPMTLEGFLEPIEERDTTELGFKYKGVKGFNPAFDVTSGKLIDGIITEKGVVPPQQIALYFSTDI